jgi:hypothetical protein
MDPQVAATLFVIITLILLIASIFIAVFLIGFIVGDLLLNHKYKRDSAVFFPLFNALLMQNAPLRDALDLYKSKFNISEKHPDFTSKFIECLEDFKVWSLENFCSVENLHDDKL